MKMRLALGCLATQLLVSGPVFAAALGDMAPPLKIAEWVKGDAVDLNEARGKQIVVVEFWATWCGPCRQSIPHLTKLQQAYRDKGVVIVGVSDEDTSKIEPFVNQMGNQMDYTVAADRNRGTFDGYMRAFGVNGIPHAFVVDREGKLAWQGHPMDGLDKALDRIVAASPAPAAAQKPGGNRLKEFIALEQQTGSAGKQQTPAQAAAQHRKLFQEYYRAVTGRGAGSGIRAMALQLEQVRSQDKEFLNEAAWTLLTDEQIQVKDPKLALHFAKQAYELTKGEDPDVLDTYARALFDNGKASEAVAQQQKAIDLSRDPQRKAELLEGLKKYQRAPAAK